jgi:hypothetical protein
MPSLAHAGSVTPDKGMSVRHAVTDRSPWRPAFNAYYGGGVVYANHGPFYAEFGGYGSAVSPYLWVGPAHTW